MLFRSGALGRRTDEQLDGLLPLLFGAGEEAGASGVDRLAERLRRAGDRRRGDERGLEPLDGALGLVEAVVQSERRQADVGVPQNRGQLVPGAEGHAADPVAERVERPGGLEESPEPELDLGVALHDAHNDGLDDGPIVIVRRRAREVADPDRPRAPRLLVRLRNIKLKKGEILKGRLEYLKKQKDNFVVGVVLGLHRLLMLLCW